MVSKPIIKQGARILPLREWYLMREKLSAKYQIICDVLLQSGMRTEEFWELVDHPTWLDESRRAIDLPRGAIGKTRCKLQERTILLTNAGVQAVKELQSHAGSIRYTDRSNMRKALRAAAEASGLGIEGIMPKMFRKMAASFLKAGLKESKDAYILASIGHSAETRQIHYLAMGFEKRDIEDMERFYKGWGE